MSAISRYDIHGKRIFESNEKLYWEDLGLRNLKAPGDMESFIEKLIENVIYKQLEYLGYEIYVGALMAGEVDFVCKKPGEKIYIQASYVIADEDTYKREFGTLERINDNHPKYVISATPLLKKRDNNGIKHLSLREFLTNGL